MRRTMHKAGLSIVLAGIVLLGSAASQWVGDRLFAQQDGKAPITMDKAFPNSNKCKRCHERVFEEWETSPLSRSIHSPAFRAALDAFLESPAGKDKALCFRCHAPHVREFPDKVQFFIDQAKSGDPQMDGVACSQCHLIKHVDRTKQPPEPKYEPAGSKTLYGPYKDFAQNLAHQSMELGLFHKSDLCLNCHQAVPSGGNLGKTNDLLGNWDQSKAIKAGKECQSCHMPEQTGESANGEKKRTVANHTFPGRIGKLRQEAAKLDIETKIEGDKTTVTVKVQSLVPHNLPTFTFPTPKDTRTFDVEATLSYAPISGPPPFLQRIEAESSKGSSDPVFQPIDIVKKIENIPIVKQP